MKATYNIMDIITDFTRLEKMVCIFSIVFWEFGSFPSKEVSYVSIFQPSSFLNLQPSKPWFLIKWFLINKRVCGIGGGHF